MSFFGHFSGFRKQLPRVDGKTFVITGSTAGTGFVAAQTVGELGGEVVMLNRQSSRVDDMLARLRKSVPEGKFVNIECDLQGFASVRKAVDEIKTKYQTIYCLANNAGIMRYPDEATVDGYDVQMQTNHLSHFLITAELFPLLKAHGDDARIVNHSSIARKRIPDGLEQQYFEKNGGNLGGNGTDMKTGGCWIRYRQSKLANSVFTQALHKKLQAANVSNVKAICAHPGVATTNLSDHFVNYGIFQPLLKKLAATFLIQSAEDGTMGLLTGMLVSDAESGCLYGPDGMKGPAISIPLQPYETDEKSMAMLWETSEVATQVTFKI